jgi:hypothetical protein
MMDTYSCSTLIYIRHTKIIISRSNKCFQQKLQRKMTNLFYGQYGFPVSLLLFELIEEERSKASQLLRHAHWLNMPYLHMAWIARLWNCIRPSITFFNNWIQNALDEMFVLFESQSKTDWQIAVWDASLKMMKWPVWIQGRKGHYSFSGTKNTYTLHICIWKILLPAKYRELTDRRPNSQHN